MSSRLIVVCTTSPTHYGRIEEGLSQGNFCVAMASSVEEAATIIKQAIDESQPHGRNPIVVLPEVLADGKPTAGLLRGMLECRHVHVILADPSHPRNFRIFTEIKAEYRGMVRIAKPPEAPEIIEMIREIAC